MKLIKNVSLFILLGLFALPGFAQDDQQPMTFFVTSVGSGNGGDVGGLAGADAHCQALAAAVGSGDATWRAYMSQAASGEMGAINARDRIGDGPWHNANGDIIAANVADLHEDRNNVRKYTALNESGDEVNGRGDQPNRHDTLTGSDSAGNLFADDAATATCNNWTSSSDDQSARLGHHARQGGPNASWNSVHTSRGCSQEALVGTGGDGLWMCFAAD